MAITLQAALAHAIKVAEEAREEWDEAPSGMRAGKILIALAGGCPGYRRDIDDIHEALARSTKRKRRERPIDKPRDDGTAVAPDAEPGA